MLVSWNLSCFSEKSVFPFHLSLNPMWFRPHAIILHIPCIRGYNMFSVTLNAGILIFFFSLLVFLFILPFITSSFGYKTKQPLNHVFSFRYPSPESFALDVRLVFDNCETFNEDDSDIGRAGHSMRKCFEKKWTDTFKVSWSYNLSLFFPFKQGQMRPAMWTEFT